MKTSRPPPSIAAQRFRLGSEREVLAYIRIGKGFAKAKENVANRCHDFAADTTRVGYPLPIPELQRRTTDMKHLLSGVAIIAALAVAVPASAQRTGPGPYAYTGTGPGVTPPGGFGPSSPLYNQPAGSPGLSGPAPLGTVPAYATQPLPPRSVPPAVSPQSP